MLDREPARFALCVSGVIPALMLLALGVTTEIHLPGIYMDGANPDFFVVPILYSDAHGLTGSTLPGNLIADKFPILSQIYHGTLPVYVGLPFYALFGTGVVGIHATHGVFAGIVLISFYVLLTSFRLNIWFCGLMSAALALDPAFLFSFRNQFYITVLPLAFIFLSAAAVNWAASATEQAKRARLIISGALTGMACFGYFVHIFFGSVIFIFVIGLRPTGLSRGRCAIAWLTGLAIGLLPYIAGFGLAALELGSIGAALEVIRGMANSLQIGRSSETLGQRFDWAANLLKWAILDIGNEAMMFDRFLPKTGEGLRLLLLLAFPFVVLMTSELLGRGERLLRLAAGFAAANFIMCLSFGTRLWVQHTAPMVPVYYLGLAGAIAMFLAAGPIAVARAFAVACLGTLLYLNSVGQRAVFVELRRTGGVGLMSDAINRFAEDTIPGASRSFYMLPEMGLLHQVLMVTRGRAMLWAHEDMALLRSRYCEGKDVAIAYLPKPNDDRAQRWIKDLNEGEPAQRVYTEKNGRELIRVLLWKQGDRRSPNCP